MNKIRIGDCLCISIGKNNIRIFRIDGIQENNVYTFNEGSQFIFPRISIYKRLEVGDYVELLHNWICLNNTSKIKYIKFVAGSKFQVERISAIKKEVYGWIGDSEAYIPFSSLKLHSNKKLSNNCRCNIFILNSIGCQCGVIVG